MAKWIHADVQDGGLLVIKNEATKQILISSYAAGDSYATVVAAALAETAMASGDFTISSSGNNRLVTTAAGKSGPATASLAAGAGNMHIAFTNGVDKVLWVTDETSEQAITSGNTVNFPQLSHTSPQPV